MIGKITEGVKLTRKSVARILAGIRADRFAMFKNNPEEFITKVIRLINEQKANMIVEQITYNQIDGTYDSAIFTAEKNTDFSRAYRAKKNVQDYVFADGYARDGQSVERKFAEEMDLADEVCVYAKLPKGFSIPTPVGNYSPDWEIAFYKGTVKHIVAQGLYPPAFSTSVCLDRASEIRYNIRRSMRGQSVLVAAIYDFSTERGGQLIRKT